MTIAKFLLKLAGDDELLHGSRTTRARSCVTRSISTPEQLALLRAGRLVDLRVKIDAEFEVHGETVAMHTIYVPPPPPPPRPGD